MARDSKILWDKAPEERPVKPNQGGLGQEIITHSTRRVEKALTSEGECMAELLRRQLILLPMGMAINSRPTIVTSIKFDGRLQTGTAYVKDFELYVERSSDENKWEVFAYKQQDNDAKFVFVPVHMR